MKRPTRNEIVCYAKALLPYIKLIFSKNVYVRLFQLFAGALIALFTGLSVLVKCSSSGQFDAEFSYGDCGLYSLIGSGLLTAAYAFTLLCIHKDKYLEIKQNMYEKYLAKLFDERMAPIMRMQQFCEGFNIRCEFLTGGCGKVEEVIKQLAESKEHLFIKAFAGMGKTRWVYEAFKQYEELGKVYYCSEVRNEQFWVSLGKLIHDRMDEEVTLVLDDCPPEVYQDCVLKCRETKRKLRLIGLTNDMNSRQVANVAMMTFSYAELSNVTKAIVNNLLDARLKDRYESRIVELSECIPYMAILLVEEINKHAGDEQYDTISLNVVDFCSRMLHFDGPNKGDEMTALESLALFSPLGYGEMDRWQYEYVMNSNHITAIVNNVNREVLFDGVVTKAKRQEILEHLSTWINVRPAPLAAWLMEEWFKSCDEGRLKAIFDELTALPKNRGTMLIEAMSHRIENMGDNRLACKLYEEIVKPGRAFSSEEVINSEMGSRLFLAMCNVNPAAMVRCLRSFLESKSIEWVRKQVIGRVRRNYVWLLEKACFPADCFEDAAMALARLAAAENESWANNATNQLGQLYHVALPGTNATLTQRLNLLREMEQMGEAYEELVINAINKAFDYGDFVRSGGQERIGSKVYKDYLPTYNEIAAYWEGVLDFIQEWMKGHEERIERMAQIFVNHVRQIGWRAGRMELVKREIRMITDLRKGPWTEMAKELRFGMNHHARIEDEELKQMMQTMGADSMVACLEETQDNFHASAKLYATDRCEENEEFFKECAERFWRDKEYDREETMAYLLDNEHFVEIWFIWALAKLPSDGELTALYMAALACMKRQHRECSSFLNLLCNATWKRVPTRCFVDKLPQEGMDVMYVQMMADHESEGLDILHDLLQRYSQRKDAFALLEHYLKRSALYSGKQMRDTYEAINRLWPKESKPLLYDYIFSRWYAPVLLEEPMANITKHCLLEMIAGRGEQRMSHEVTELLSEVLEKEDDDDFVKKLNRQLIRSCDQLLPSSDCSFIYDKMLPKYEKVILQDILDALAGEEPMYYLNMMHCLGVGVNESKSSAPLFKCDRETIKAFCLQKAATTFPRRLATMIPIYAPEDAARFDEFLLWMLDNLNLFASSDEVLSAIHSNINSFACTGSVILLYERQRACFEQIKGHKNKLVADWANRNIAEIDERIRLEFRHESYQHIKYR